VGQVKISQPRSIWCGATHFPTLHTFRKMKVPTFLPLDRAEILTADPRHIVLDFDRLDLESEVCGESSFYRKVPVVLVVDNIDLCCFLVHNFLYSIIFNLNVNTNFLELYTSCSFVSKITNCLHNVFNLDWIKIIRISYFPRETYVVWFLICVFKCLCENIGYSMGKSYLI